MMPIVDHEDVTRYRDRVMPLLLQRECENCVMIGILERLAAGRPATRSAAPCIPLLLAVQDGAGDVCAAAVQTPPHALLLSPLDESSAATIVDHLHQRRWDGDQLSGIVSSVRHVAERWRARCGRGYSLQRSLQLYRTSRVIDPPAAGGELRAATDADALRLSEWVGAFGEEIGEPFPDPLHTAQLAIEEKRLHLWFDAGEARAICAWQGPTPNSVRIGLVYTPPPFRGRGYASNAVAELTRRLLASGRSYCTLFTDRSNPTSNSIYAKIGYEPVADFEHVRFDRSPGAS